MTLKLHFGKKAWDFFSLLIPVVLFSASFFSCQGEKKELTDRYGRLPREAENMLLKIMLRVYCIQAGIQRLDISPDVLTLTFSEKHRKKPPDSLTKHLKNIFQFEFIKRDSIRIQLGKNRNNISRALLETRNILKAII